MATLYLRNGIYYIQYYYRGERKQKSLKTRDPETAQEKLAEQEARMVLQLEEQHPANISFKDFVGEYSDWAKEEKSDLTHRTYDKYRLSKYKKLFRGRRLKAITAKEIRQYVTERKAACAVSTVNREIRLIKALFNKAVEWKYLTESPAAGLKESKQRQRIPRFFSEKEVDLIQHKALDKSSYLYLLIRLDVNTGLRKGELIHLAWADINFDNDTIIVQSKDEWHPKDYEIRSIPISRDLSIELKEHKLKQQGLTKWVFPTIFGTLRKNNLGRDFVNLLEKCGLYDQGVGWHTLRHTFASHLVMNGVPLKAVSYLLGHKSVKTTEIYSHLSPEHTRESIEKLPFKPAKKGQNGYSFGDSNEKGVKQGSLTP